MEEDIKLTSDIEHSIADIIRTRRSGRAYANREVESHKIKSLFEAARWAPSSMNEQPWFYVYATKDQKELHGKIFDALMEANQVWVKDAPLLVLSLVRKKFIRNNHENSSAKYDVGAANAMLSLQATELGLNVHQMGGFDPSKVKHNLNVPDDFEPGVIMAIGYPGDPAQLSENLKKREVALRYRMIQDEFVMNKSF